MQFFKPNGQREDEISIAKLRSTYPEGRNHSIRARGAVAHL